MCPWPRIQAALIDRETLMVTYRTDRGEPRGPHKKGQPWEGRGHCIDCNQCVAACPMGIDIRDGEQLECINCALCIDACDAVMKKVALPLGLIAYDTPQNIERRKKGEKGYFTFARPRVLLYAAALAAVAAIMLLALSTRATIDLNVLRDRNPNFVQLSDGSVRNAYTVKVMNHAATQRDLELAIEGPPGFSTKIIGIESAARPALITVEADRLRTVRVLVTVPMANLTAASMPIVFKLAKDGETQSNATVFLSDGGAR
jgi:cytochrome c oxidase accessory protein FixG